MRVLRPRLPDVGLAVFAVAGALTVAASYVSVDQGAYFSVGAVLAAAVFVATVIGFIFYPHWAVAATVLLFALVPALKVFVSPEIGGIKDLVVVAAGCATLILIAFERRRPDRVSLVLVLLLLALYAINATGAHGVAWAQGLRLVAEPLLLLIVGFTLPNPRRTFRYALAALIATCCLVAAYGIMQQLVGKWTLVEWGYSFESQVRSLPNGTLRSFGTLDDPFAYSALLSFGIVGVVFGWRRGALAWGAGGLILLGLGLGFVRTTILVLVVLVGLLLRRWGSTVTAVLVVAATIVAGTVILVNAGGSEETSYAVPGSTNESGAAGSANVILNGRISAWEAALGPNPGAWVFGRGVGEVGTGAARAGYTIAPPTDTAEEDTSGEPNLAVDSGYLATIADVGLGGLVLLIALFGRLIRLAADAARRRISAGWVALGLLAALLVDALTRASFTGFPTAFLGLLLIGICLAAAREESGSGAPTTATAS